MIGGGSKRLCRFRQRRLEAVEGLWILICWFSEQMDLWHMNFGCDDNCSNLEKWRFVKSASLLEQCELW